MTIKVMDTVLSRLYLDEKFRELLRHDPERALAGYDLTPHERAALSRLKKCASRTKSSESGLETPYDKSSRI